MRTNLPEKKLTYLVYFSRQFRTEVRTRNPSRNEKIKTRDGRRRSQLLFLSEIRLSSQ